MAFLEKDKKKKTEQLLVIALRIEMCQKFLLCSVFTNINL